MIICVSEPYLHSKPCQLELEYGFKKDVPLIVVKLDPNCDVDDHIVLASQIYVNYALQFIHSIKKRPSVAR